MSYRSMVDLGMFLEALTLLHLSKFIILFIPFKKIAERLGSLNKTQQPAQLHLAKIKSIHVAIMRAVKISIHSSRCYDQALTARWMLGMRKIPSTIYFGVSKKDNMLTAHAWVKAGEYIVTGKGGMENFTPVAFFTHQVNTQ